MKHTLVAWMHDRPGVLNRVAGMIRRRNFNIDSLQVGHSETPGISRMTFVVDGDQREVDQVIKQLRKVIDVTNIENISEKPIVAREMVLIRIATTAQTRSEIVQVVDLFRGDIVDVAGDSMVAQIVGSQDRIDSLLELLNTFGILEMVRTGPVAMKRGGSGRSAQRTTTVWRASSNGAAPEESGRFSTGGV